MTYGLGVISPITRRSQVRILPPLLLVNKGLVLNRGSFFYCPKASIHLLSNEHMELYEGLNFPGTKSVSY